jgi:hypothetical protein
MNPDEVVAAYSGWLTTLEDAAAPEREHGNVPYKVRHAARHLSTYSSTIQAHDRLAAERVPALLSKAYGEPETPVGSSSFAKGCKARVGTFFREGAF